MAPNPPRTAPCLRGRFTTPYIVAPHTAPDKMRAANGPGFNRLGVKGSLSAINSLTAKSVILFDALAEMIVANGEFPRRIHLRFAAQARTAGAAMKNQPTHAISTRRPCGP